MSEKEHAEDYPLAYRDGEVDFYGRRFVVTKDTLIPRPETEMAIDAVKLLAGQSILSGVKPPRRKLSDAPRILDVGTGSGCIAVTVATELPEAEVVACDVSVEALKVAEENAKRLGVSARVKCVKSDLLANIEGKFDVVVANLPYVDKSWEWLKEPDSAGLKYEPSLALYAEDGGLAMIFRLLDEMGEREGFTRWLILEADPCQHEAIVAQAEQKGFALEEIRGYQIVLKR